MLRLALERAEGRRASGELRLEILPLLRHQFYLGLDLFDLLLPILKDEQLLQFRLHARMLWAEPTIVNRANTDLLATPASGWRSKACPASRRYRACCARSLAQLRDDIRGEVHGIGRK